MHSTTAPEQFAIPSRAQFEMFLASGGDSRIRLDPFTGRNRYGTPVSPTNGEIWFSSSTATAISRRGYAAARFAFDKWMGDSNIHQSGASAWCDSLRDRIVACVGVRGTQAILSASGTESEILALTLARSILRRPITNIVVAPNETGSGVMAAAAGKHFDELAAVQGVVKKGERLEGWEGAPTETLALEIRNGDGAMRTPTEIDADALACVDEALAAGRDVVLHVLDTSKTGQGGPSRELARTIACAASDRVIVVVDACQLRCSIADIRADLGAGFLVMITGSKFVAGPPFCGALLVPPARLAALSGMRVPPGLACYSARFDWPLSLRPALLAERFAPVNIGLGLRWEAALSELEAYLKVDASRRQDIASAFTTLVESRVRSRSHLRFLDAPELDGGKRIRTIFPIVTSDGELERTHQIFRALRGTETSSRVCHVGQPVASAGGSALRICLSMPIVTAIAARIGERNSLQGALRPIEQDMDLVFDKWDRLAEKPQH
jgi:hypothetical protein